jgi:hypothetical protein
MGEASDETPLLEAPLKGPVYAVSGFGLLPHLAFILGGQVMVIPEAESKTIAGGRLQTTVPIIPDAPVGHFHFTVFGGSRGYISNTESLCAHAPLVGASFTGQNGKTETQQVKTKTVCKPKKHKKHKRKSSKRHRSAKQRRHRS